MDYLLPTHDPRTAPQVGDVINYHLGQDPDNQLVSTTVTDYDKETQLVKFLIQLPNNQINGSMKLLGWQAWWDGFPIKSIINADQPNTVWD